MTPDVNVLVAAARLEHPHHSSAKAWLHSAISSASAGGRVALLPTVIAGFLRITTNRKVFPVATPIGSALEFVDSMLGYDGVSVLSSGREWPQFRSLCIAHSLSANSIPDAWIAAQVLEHGEVLATFDNDFTRLLPAKNLLLLVA
jgi:uncharacterized protein